MRILMLSTWFPYPPDNGAKLRAYHLLRALAKEHEVTLISFAFDTAQPEQPGDLHSLCADIRVVPVNPFAVNRAATWRTFLSSRPMAFRPIPAMSQLVTDVLRSQAFEAVVASTEMMADYALLAPAGTVRILEEHNSMVRWARERYEGARGPAQHARCWLGWQKARRHETGLYPRFDLATMVSEPDRVVTVATIGKGGPRVEVIPNGVDCAHNRPGLAATQPRSLVYNGSLTYGPNYDAMKFFLAEIYPLLQEQMHDISMTITGSTSGVDLSRLRLGSSVRLTGYVTDIRPTVAAASVCVVPIRQCSGTRLKVLEAMALGTPVVSTTKGAEGLEVMHGEHIMLADNPTLFAEYILQIVRDPATHRRLAEKARALVEVKYDWESIGQQFRSLVERVVQDNAQYESLSSR